ncbi:hypothetical protein R8Z50_18385 [Longispora sp. K20-0274]|uniref:hypothetical protein n=1 Tax=Longispora sp. K20-0274 TaxID=3088255 RepID=UPI00399B9E2F
MVETRPAGSRRAGGVGVVRLLVGGVAPWSSAGRRAARYRPGPGLRIIVPPSPACG